MHRVLFSGDQMPRKKSPLTLQAQSVAAVAHLMHELNNSIEPSDRNPSALPVENLGTGTRLYPVGDSSPFGCYPSAVIQEVISYMGSFTRRNHQKMIRKEILQMLLCRSMEQLDLSGVRIHEDELADVLKTVEYFARNIHTLNVFAESFGMVPKELFDGMMARTGVSKAMVSLCTKLSNVTHLYLHNVCHDELMDVIGSHCPVLHTFRAMSENVTDVGLRSLCQNVNDPTDTALRCQRLHKISLDPRAEGISSAGVKCLLQHLPQIAEIEGCVIGHVLEEIHGDQQLDELVDKDYKIKHFMYDWRESHHHPLRGVKIMLHTCPYVTSLKLLEPTNDALVLLGNLLHLQSITIITYSNNTSFDRGVLPLLQQAGANVEKLTLCLKKINLSAIDLCCPKLKCLECNIVEQVENSAERSAAPFASLVDLVFHANSRATLSTESIKLLLSCCHGLEYLYISCCNSFTDSVLQDILHLNPLTRLKYLHLMYVESITVVGIELLVSQESDLKRVWLFDAAGVYKAALRKMKDRIGELNLDLRINDDLL